MRIFISGTHGIGKTTLAQALSEYSGMPIIKEHARELLENDFDFNNVCSDLDDFRGFQQKILEMQLRDIAQNKDGIFDRSPIDSWAYVIERLSKDRIVDYRNWLEDYHKLAFDTMMDCIVQEEDIVINLMADYSYSEIENSNRNLSLYYAQVISYLISMGYSYIEDRLNRYGIAVNEWLFDRPFSERESWFDSCKPLIGIRR